MNRQILKLAVPNIVTNITIPLLSTVDLALMGHLESEEYIGAVALSGMIFTFIYSLFGWLRASTTGFTAQAYGRKDDKEIRLIFDRSILVSMAGGLFLIIFQKPIALLSFYIVEGSHEVETLALEYFFIRIYAAPATLGLYVITGWFLGMQDAKSPMILAILINVLNILFNILFVMGMGMKSDGVALGTLLAQYSGFITGAIILLTKYYNKINYWNFKEILSKKAISQFFTVNRDLMIRSICLIFTFSFFTAQSAKISDGILAVNTILLQYFMIFSYLIDGFAYAAESLTGRFIGEGNVDRLRRVIRYLFIWGLFISIPFTLAYLFFGENLIFIMTDNPGIINEIRPYLFWIAMVPLITFTSFLWDGIYIGATASKPMRNTMLISTLIVFLPSYYIFIGLLGNHGLWLALMLFMIIRGILMTVFAKKAIYSSLRSA
jgi:MATE family multidrug resistance protein